MAKRHSTRQREKKRRLHGGRVLAFLAVLGISYLIALFVRIALAGRTEMNALVDPADVIIVLGAAQYDGRPSPVYRARLDHALALYRAGCAPYLLFTGGKQKGDRFTEAEAGRRYALAREVPDSAIIIEPYRPGIKSQGTWQSLQSATTSMRDRRLRTAILVSDPFHVYRLRRMARDLGMHAHISPDRNSPIRSIGMKTQFILREVALYSAYRLFGI